MSITILRTPDAWWVRTPGGAARIDTDAMTTGELLAEPEPDRGRPGEQGHRRPGHPRAGVPGDGALPGGGADDELRQPREGRGSQPGHHPADVLPEDVGLAQRPVRRHHPPRARALPGLRGRDRPGDRPGAAGGHGGHGGQLGLVRGRLGGDQRRLGPRRAAAQDPVLRVQVVPDASRRSDRRWSCSTTTSSSGSATCACASGSTASCARTRWSTTTWSTPRCEALQALSRFQRLDAGDLLLTGTPAGTALSAPPKPLEIIATFLPPALKWKIFFQRQAQNPKYLKHGDVVEVAIGTDDGAIDLGRQRTVVRSA